MLIDFPWQARLCERAPILCFTYVAWLLMMMLLQFERSNHEMGGSCSTFNGEERCVQGPAWEKETILKTWA